MYVDPLCFMSWCMQLTVVLDTAALPKELLLYTSLYLELLFESPLLRDGGEEGQTIMN